MRMTQEDRIEFVDIAPYLIQGTQKLLLEIESKILPNEVKLRKVYDSVEHWQVNKESPNVIDMREHDEGNIVCFTHELLHIYFNFVLKMFIYPNSLPILTNAYESHPTDPWNLANRFITLINHLQHHKMIPYFEEFNFPLEKIIDNYENPLNIYQSIDDNIKVELPLNISAFRYQAALDYVNFLALELYFPNPIVKEKIRNSFSNQYDKKYAGLREMFQPILEKWNTEYKDLPQLINEIHDKAKEHAERV